MDFLLGRPKKRRFLDVFWGDVSSKHRFCLRNTISLSVSVLFVWPKVCHFVSFTTPKRTVFPIFGFSRIFLKLSVSFAPKLLFHYNALDRLRELRRHFWPSVHISCRGGRPSYSPASPQEEFSTTRLMMLAHCTGMSMILIVTGI